MPPKTKASSRVEIIPEALDDVEVGQDTRTLNHRLVKVGRSVGKTLFKGLILGIGIGAGMYPFASSWVEGFGEKIAPVSGGLNQVSEKTDDLRETVEVEANGLRSEDGGIKVTLDGFSITTTTLQEEVIPTNEEAQQQNQEVVSETTTSTTAP